MVLKEKNLSIHQPHHLIVDIGGYIEITHRHNARTSQDYVCRSKYLSCYHSALMEVAGFILEALTACQLTVITAMVSDNNKDMIKVQNGNCMR